MQDHARIDEAHETDEFPIADSAAGIDNASVAGNAMMPLGRRVEHWLISLGMSVFAYLLERVILRSIKRGGTEP